MLVASTDELEQNAGLGVVLVNVGYTLILGVAEKPACPNRLWSILLTA